MSQIFDIANTCKGIMKKNNLTEDDCVELFTEMLSNIEFDIKDFCYEWSVERPKEYLFPKDED